MNAYFTKDIADHRHAELIARAEQSRRYRQARAVRSGASGLASGDQTPPYEASGQSHRGVRHPFAAVRAWLVAGVL